MKIKINFLLFLLIFYVFSFGLVRAEEEISISLIEEKPYQEGDLVKVLGKNFGTDLNNLKVKIGKKKYSVKKSYGNELYFELSRDVSTDYVEILKTIEVKNKKETLVSNKYKLNLKTPRIVKVETKNSLKPNEEIKITGFDFLGTEFWCDTYKFKSKVSDEEVFLTIPNQTLDCNLETIKNGFQKEWDIPLKVKIFPKIFKVSYQDNKDEKKIIINGENFFAFKKTQKNLKFYLGEKSFSKYEIISDTKIEIPKINSVIPVSGIAYLEVDSIKSPMVTYFFDKVDYPKITNLGSIFYNNEKESFVIPVEISSSSNSYEDLKVCFNNSCQEIDEKNRGRNLEMTFSSLPSLPAYIKVQGNFFYGEEVFYNDYPLFSPYLSSLDLDDGLGVNGSDIIYLEGGNFISKDSVQVDHSLKGEGTLKWFNSKKIRFQFPGYSSEKEDFLSTLRLSVKTFFGTTKSITLDLPQEAKKIKFYPQKEYVVFPQGKFLGRLMQIYGYSFDNLKAIKFNDQETGFIKKNNNLLEIKIPQDIDLEGTWSFVPQTLNDLEETKKHSYKFYQEPKNNVFSLRESDKKEISDNNIFSLDLENYQEKPLILDIYLKFSCVQEENNCLKSPPIKDYSLSLDANDLRYKKEISADFTYILFSNIYIPIKEEKQELLINYEKADTLLADETWSFKIEKINIKEKNKEENLYLDKSLKKIDKIDLKEIKFIKNETVNKNLCYEKNRGFDEELEESLEFVDCNFSKTEKDKENEQKQTETDLDNNKEEKEEVFFLEEEEKKEEEKIEIIIPLREEHEKINFTDISLKDWFYPYIEDLFQRGIINGYTKTLFKPSGTLNRAELLKMVLVARGEDSSKWGEHMTVSFLDTENHWAKNLLEYALKNKYIKRSKYFQPLKTVTRAETMKMLCKMFPIFDIKDTDTHFQDLEDHWGKNCIMSAYDLGIVKGSEENKFEPNKKVLRTEFAKMLSKVLELYQIKK